MQIGYFVKKYRSKADISVSANSLRARLGIDNFYSFNIVRTVREKMIGKDFPIIGTMKLKLFNDAENPDDKAFITYEETSFTLNVHEEIWELAEMGEPESRYIIAHELGHIVMHNDYKREFSPITAYNKSFITDVQHSEWQANTFAGHFLAPAKFLSNKTTPEDLARQFDFPLAYANDYLTTKSVPNRRYIGEACTDCANFTLVRCGTSLTCDTCGATSGSG